MFQNYIEEYPFLLIHRIRTPQKSLNSNSFIILFTQFATEIKFEIPSSKTSIRLKRRNEERAKKKTSFDINE